MSILYLCQECVVALAGHDRVEIKTIGGTGPGRCERCSSDLNAENCMPVSREGFARAHVIPNTGVSLIFGSSVLVEGGVDEVNGEDGVALAFGERAGGK